MVSKDATFIKLTHDEVLSRISHLIVSEGDIRIWKKEVFSFNGSVLNSSEEDDSFILTIKCDKIQESYKGKDLLIHFVVREVNFFGKAKVGEFKMGCFKLALDKDLYKYEKRRSERLLSFPHHKIYAYFAFEKQLNKHDNVAFLNRGNHQQEQLFQRFVEEKFFHDDDHGNLTGFRVVDISNNGLSFFSNELERSYFMVRKKSYQLIIDFNGVTIKTIAADVVYEVPYVNPRAQSVPMFKIGMNFQETHPALVEQIEKILGKEEPETDLNDEFEKFLK